MTFSGSNDNAQKTALRREADAWIRLLTSGKATSDDVKALQHWRGQGPAHRAAFEDAKRLWRDFGPAGEMLLQQCRQAPGSNPVDRHAMSRRAFLGGMAVATVAGAAAIAEYPLLGRWAPMSEWGADYRTATGEQRRVRLPGDIMLAMNTQTSVALLRHAGRVEGLTLLSGEAAIDAQGMAYGRFRVASEHGMVTASLPARFEVRSNEGRTCVTCLSGRIEVRAGDRNWTLLDRQRIDYGDGGLETVRSLDPEIASAWRDGVIVFRQTPLPEAISEINRYRRGRVVLMNRDLERQAVSGRFSIRNMDLVIAQIQQAFSARVTKLPGDIVLLG